MAGQIVFFKKNIIDIDNNKVAITVTDSVATGDGEDFVNFIRNRRNDSAWITTGSSDAGGTTMEIDWEDGRDVADILLLKHNFKSFTLKYWNGSAFVDFSPAINETANTDSTTWFQVTSVETRRIQLVINSTQVANDEKFLYQMIVSKKILNGQLEGWPIIKSPKHSTNKRKSKMLSGKTNVVESLGAFSCSLSVASWNNDNDMSIMENIYFARQGILVWLCGGDELQFATKRIGYRKEDIYLMRPTDDYEPSYYKGLYKAGIVFSITLEESIN